MVLLLADATQFSPENEVILHYEGNWKKSKIEYDQYFLSHRILVNISV